MQLPFKLPSTKFLFAIVSISSIVLFVFYINAIQYLFTNWRESVESQETSLEIDEDEFGVRTAGCTIPEMDIWDDSIKEFIFDEKEITCDHVKPALVDSTAITLYVIETNLKYYEINNTDLFKCYYQPFHRIDPPDDVQDTLVSYDETIYEINSYAIIDKFEFVKAFCEYNETEIYKEFFDFIPLKNFKQRLEGDESLNILIIGIDSVSRLNFHRQMPKTLSLLQQLNSVEMLGFNKIGDNSFPNQIPILTGLTKDDLIKVCWPTQDDYFDKCPLIWKRFKKMGYTTAFAEDAAWMGLFHYEAMGFKQQPTDYYWNPFSYLADEEIGSSYNLNVNECIGSKPAHTLILRYITRFVEAMRVFDNKYFAYFWGTVLAHDYFNKPKLADADYYDLISGFAETGVLNNTLLILMSDHGIRWGDVRSTYQGMIEERLPLLHLILPEWYSKQHRLLFKNLRINRKRLTTPLDLHETLKDLLYPSNLTDRLLKQRPRKIGAKRSYSFFNEISPERTCEDAGISSHWCTCQVSEDIDTNSTVALEAANFILDNYINSMLQNYSKCAVLELDNILVARVNFDSYSLSENISTVDYSVTFRATPGGGLFEGTVRKLEDYFSVTGSVSRINLYGNQSSCVRNTLHKLYCYCI